MLELSIKLLNPSTFFSVFILIVLFKSDSQPKQGSVLNKRHNVCTIYPQGVDNIL